MAYAEAGDVQERLGRTLDGSEATIVTVRLGDAELLIKSRIRDLDTKVASGEIDEAVVVMVEAEMVLRLVKNPDGYLQETDGNYSYMISSQVASGRLEVLPEEWALLGVSGGMFVIAPELAGPLTEPTALTPYTAEQAVRDGWA